jgi:type II secretory pathway component GspD/PulD (secretin)
MAVPQKVFGGWALIFGALAWGCVGLAQVATGIADEEKTAAAAPASKADDESSGGATVSLSSGATSGEETADQPGKPGGPPAKPDEKSGEQPGKPGEPGAALRKPGEKPGKPGEQAKPDEGPKPTQRPIKPPVPPNPDELKVRPDESGKLRFSFTGQPWQGVLEWLAGISGMSLDWQELPGDYLNLSTQRSYTIREVRDLINRHLLARGYTLLCQGEVLTVANIKKLDRSLVPRVTPEELARRDPFEFVKVSLPLDWLVAEEAVKELEPMLSPNGKLVALSAINRLEAVDAAINLRELCALLREEQSASGQERLMREFPLQYARADDVRDQLLALLGIETKGPTVPVPGMPPNMDPEQMQAMMSRMQQSGGPKPPGSPGGPGGPAVPSAKPKPQVNLAVNRRMNSILANAPPDKMAIIEQAIKAIDVPSDRSQSFLANAGRMHIYRLSGVDPEPVVKTLQEIGNLDPTTQLKVDKKNKAIIAYAPLVDHVTIGAVVEKLKGSERQFEVIRLRRLAADYVAGTVEFMMTGPKKKETRQSPWFYGYSSSSRDQTEDENKFRVDADVEHNRLLLWANEVELAEVQKLLVKLGEIPPKGESDTVRVLDSFEGKEAEELLERIRRAWPSLAPNALQVVPPRTTEKSAPQRPAEPADEEPPQPSPTKTTEARPNPLPIRFAQLRREQPGDERPAAAAESADKPAAPVKMAFGPDGRLIISSQDTQALDMLEELVTELAPRRKDYKVFRLKYAWAYGVMLNLQEFFKEDEKKQTGYRPWYFYDFGSGDEDSKDEGRRLSKRRKLKFISDSDSNSILVEGADRAQLRTIEDLIALYDQPSPTDSQSARKTEPFHLQYSKAKTVAETVKDVYRDLLSENDKALLGSKGEQRESGRMYTYIFNDGGDSKGDQKTPKFKGLLSVGIDDLSNTLVVSAPAYLFDHVAKLIKALDEAAAPTSTVRVVRVGPSVSAERVQEILADVLGEGGSSNHKQSTERSSRRHQQQPTKSGASSTSSKTHTQTSTSSTSRGK